MDVQFQIEHCGYAIVAAAELCCADFEALWRPQLARPAQNSQYRKETGQAGPKWP